jgi:hypothetical protein
MSRQLSHQAIRGVLPTDQSHLWIELHYWLEDTGSGQLRDRVGDANLK